MDSQDLRVILDDNTGDIQYSGGDWIKSDIVQWYQATSTYPASARNGVFGSLSLSFEGELLELFPGEALNANVY
jgi:hypothetical protein